MSLRLYFNKQNANFEEPVWCLHDDETNEVHKLEKIISFGADNETEKSPIMPNLRADWVLKYFNCTLEIKGMVGFISPKAGR